ncbi:MAG: SUMF1/EgtB/PvdO family nonheme iron enzyme [Armatimonadetes bacterium]|nr:SUMF1/EgtB/PvdO family nonheme iron enzyme [Armatimonadota bacterium]
MALSLAVIALSALSSEAQQAGIMVPFSPAVWQPDGADARWLEPAEAGELETNAHYIRAPRPGQPYEEWRASLKRLRREARDGKPPSAVHVDFRGTRAWTRLKAEAGQSLSLEPGEEISLSFEARWLSGNPQIGFALDYLSLRTGQWAGWSEVFASVRIPQDGQWHALGVSLKLPRFDRQSLCAVPIIGQDATFNPAVGVWEMRAVTLRMKSTPPRIQTARKIEQAAARAAKGLDLSIYSRPDMAWVTRNFTCYFVFAYDRNLYDREKGRYRVDALLDDLERRFGGADSVVLWQAYPRIGVDERNQFDFYRDMPGGLEEVRRAVSRFRRRGVKVFIDYNPWDTGTRREPVPDEVALGKLAKALGADGIFLDTMTAAPDTLRSVIDSFRKGVAFEPEGSPGVEQLGVCSASWAQWLADYPEPGVLRLKWIEPRHMQHQIRRWNASHREEIEAAFFNGSGMLVWDNIFGTYNPWNEEDSLAWRKASPILRAFDKELASERWEPCLPALQKDVFISRWPGEHADLYLIVNRAGGDITGPVLRLPSAGPKARVFDLWRQEEIPAAADGAVRVPLGRWGAIAVAHDPIGLRQAQAAMPKADPPPRDVYRETKPHTPKPVSRTAPPDSPPPNMALIPRSSIYMRIQHERRECGCYPDPGTPPEREGYFLFGSAWNEPLIHDYGPVEVGPFWIDECLVTNGEYEAFLKATGHRPRDPTNFLKHWPGRKCPPALRDHPVVYVDLEDARAYAKWAGKRLPTEEEWQRAAQGSDGRKWPWGDTFDAARCSPPGKGTTPVRAFPGGRSPVGCYDMSGNVWQWTESERDDGHTRYAVIRGGSHFRAEGSVWYVQGGPQPLDRHTKMILMYPGLDRCATIGFRCVRDADR